MLVVTSLLNRFHRFSICQTIYVYKENGKYSLYTVYRSLYNWRS